MASLPGGGKRTQVGSDRVRSTRLLRIAPGNGSSCHSNFIKILSKSVNVFATLRVHSSCCVYLKRKHVHNMVSRTLYLIRLFYKIMSQKISSMFLWEDTNGTKNLHKLSVRNTPLVTAGNQILKSNASVILLQSKHCLKPVYQWNGIII